MTSRLDALPGEHVTVTISDSLFTAQEDAEREFREANAELTAAFFTLTDEQANTLEKLVFAQAQAVFRAAGLPNYRDFAEEVTQDAILAAFGGKGITLDADGHADLAKYTGPAVNYASAIDRAETRHEKYPAKYPPVTAEYILSGDLCFTSYLLFCRGYLNRVLMSVTADPERAGAGVSLQDAEKELDAISLDGVFTQSKPDYLRGVTTRDFLRGLSGKDRSLLQDVFDGYTQQEIAAKQSINQSVISRRLGKIRRKAEWIVAA